MNSLAYLTFESITVIADCRRLGESSPFFRRLLLDRRFVGATKRELSLPLPYDIKPDTIKKVVDFIQGKPIFFGFQKEDMVSFALLGDYFECEKLLEKAAKDITFEEMAGLPPSVFERAVQHLKEEDLDRLFDQKKNLPALQRGMIRQLNQQSISFECVSRHLALLKPHLRDLETAHLTTDQSIPLLKECPNIKKLVLAKGCDLRLLKYVPQLETLIICSDDINSLECLRFVPHLLHLELFTNFPERTFENLAYVPELQSLKISKKQQGDVLQYLIHTRKLRSLDLEDCTMVRGDLSQPLSYTPELEKLIAPRGLQSLKMLEKVSHLKELSIVGYRGDDLDNLQFVPDLEVLNLSCRDSLTFLRFVPKLQKLTGIHDNNQEDFFEPLAYVPSLRYLSFSYSIRRDCLKALSAVPLLRTLEARCCCWLQLDYLQHISQLEHLILRDSCFMPNALSQLHHVKGLLRLNLTDCSFAESDVLQHLEHVPYLEELWVGGCVIKSHSLTHLSKTPNLRKVYGVRELDLSYSPSPLIQLFR